MNKHQNFQVRLTERAEKQQNFKNSIIPGNFYEGNGSRVESYLEFPGKNNGKPFT